MSSFPKTNTPKIGVRRSLGIFVGVALLAFSFAPVSADLDGIRTRLEPKNPLLIGLGLGVYQDNCAACHGENLEGQTLEDTPDSDDDTWIPAPAHDETGHTWHHPDDELFDLVKYGFATALQDPDYPMWMPAYEGILTDEEIVAVLSYIKSTWSQDIQNVHDQKNALEDLYWKPFVH